MSTKRIRWTDEEISLLKQLWNNMNVSMDDMASVLKSRSIPTIKQKASTLGLPPFGSRQKPDIDYEFLKKITNPEDI